MSQCDPPELDWIVVPGRKEHLARVQEFVLDQASRHNIPLGLTQKLELVLEEVVLNIVNYAYSEEQRGTIQAGCSCPSPGLFHIRLIDQGHAFNPLALPNPDTGLALEDREVGGLGVHLVREMADKVEYQRHNGQNILDIHFAW